jgi:hypothetical protein
MNFFAPDFVVFINRKRRNVSSVPLEIAPKNLAGVRVFSSAIGICVHNFQLENKAALGNFDAPT